MLFRKRKKNKQAVAEEKNIKDTIHQELGGYLKREELQKYLEKIKRDERQKRLWDSLSTQKKIKVLKYVLEKRGDKDAKK